MKELYENAGFILAFLIGVLLFQIFVGKKMTTYALALILLGQIIINPKVIEGLQFKPTLGELGEPDVSAGLRTNNPIYKGGGVIQL
jgi:hypothetical protein